MSNYHCFKEYRFDPQPCRLLEMVPLGEVFPSFSPSFGSMKYIAFLWFSSIFTESTFKGTKLWNIWIDATVVIGPVLAIWFICLPRADIIQLACGSMVSSTAHTWAAAIHCSLTTAWVIVHPGADLWTGAAHDKAFLRNIAVDGAITLRPLNTTGEGINCWAAAQIKWSSGDDPRVLVPYN